ncbi:MAG TPA: DinB family protein [Saprospiraceae bacterium]|nr:DinB family protein [Saprospiraceae bacterium]
MELNKYLIDTFMFNDKVNRKVLEKMKKLPDQKEAIRLFSHLINSQNKWHARIMGDPDSQNLDWWVPVHPLDELESKWQESLERWLHFLADKTEEELVKEVTFIGYDGGVWAATTADIALQLNYHSIHHRAQIQSIIRQQGLVPGFVDYIGTRYRKLS